MANKVLDVTFPVEVQTVDQNDTISSAATSQGKSADEDVKIDAVQLQICAEGPDCYSVVLRSETDVFFNLGCKITRPEFDVLRREQQLVVGFEGFPGALNKLLHSCIHERVTHAALLVLEGEAASLHIVCKMEHKIVELLSFPLQKLSEQELHDAIQKRFAELRARLEFAETKVAEFTSMLRSGKVPSLFHKPVTNGSHHQHKPGW